MIPSCHAFKITLIKLYNIFTFSRLYAHFDSLIQKYKNFQTRHIDQSAFS